MRTIRASGLCAAMVLLMLAGGFIASSRAEQASTPRSATPEATLAVVRHVLSSSEPAAAPGETLALVEYVIPAGAVLPIHTHPGLQMATVASGTLTYHVIEHGRVVVTRADGSEEVVGPGETVTFGVGDSWVEPEGMVHYAENLTSQPVVLMASSLLADDQPPTQLIQATPAA